jgi:hypothetical protein
MHIYLYSLLDILLSNCMQIKLFLYFIISSFSYVLISPFTKDGVLNKIPINLLKIKL